LEAPLNLILDIIVRSSRKSLAGCPMDFAYGPRRAGFYIDVHVHAFRECVAAS
jgi:hypothetical protein